MKTIQVILMIALWCYESVIMAEFLMPETKQPHYNFEGSIFQQFLCKLQADFFLLAPRTQTHILWAEIIGSHQSISTHFSRVTLANATFF